ncbi:hypothetical protein CALCODRAFT_368415 [Calocera cornea HHB12733]|uniref:Uncharacterized protein n=1 Tax=Calocera cornea HHB12733 TaxID=1353952 RepID=A0A165EJG6_9BASI|nr:hypothetical protein CALCODRAFT_368415 [Calocera cornea HHB12733]
MTRASAHPHIHPVHQSATASCITLLPTKGIETPPSTVRSLPDRSFPAVSVLLAQYIPHSTVLYSMSPTLALFKFLVDSGKGKTSQPSAPRWASATQHLPIQFNSIHSIQSFLSWAVRQARNRADTPRLSLSLPAERAVPVLYCCGAGQAAAESHSARNPAAGLSLCEFQRIPDSQSSPRQKALSIRRLLLSLGNLIGPSP